MTLSELVAQLPAHIVLGYGDGLNADEVRDRLAALGEDDPERGHCIADELMRCALHLIADGHPNPAQIARDALTITSVEFPRWMA
jgi:hypothetical protein